MKRLIICLGITLMAACSVAQQGVLSTQHWVTKNIYNPASSGTMKFMNANVLVRKQWVGFKGSPTTGIFTFDVPFHEQHMGAGLTVMEDRVGVTNHLKITGNYHYHIELSDDWKLAFGLSAGASILRSSYTDHIAWDEDDPMIAADRQSIVPNFGFGTYLWKDEFTYVGIGIPQLLSYNPGDAIAVEDEQFPNLERHYYLQAGYAFDLDETWALQPNTMMRYVPGAPFQFDIGSMIVYNEIIAAGLSYRLGDAASAMIRARIAKRLVMGYAYDYTLSSMRRYSSGSHEAYLSYRFGEEQEKYRGLFNPQ